MAALRDQHYAYTSLFVAKQPFRPIKPKCWSEKHSDKYLVATIAGEINGIYSSLLDLAKDKNTAADFYLDSAYKLASDIANFDTPDFDVNFRSWLIYGLSNHN